MDNTENRKFARIPGRHLVKCEKFVLEQCGWSPKISNVTKNISAEGVLFETDQPYDVGDVVRLELNLPGWTEHINRLGFDSQLPQTDTQVLVGTVLRVEAVDGKHYDVGVCFTEMSKNDRWALMSYLYETPEAAP